ncbi:MAG: indolepyruvate oxidoreductase subunit beta [Kiritimatiellae bacterium]|nr:indolepyruvate oxidoreductase subunit beta [Kiritimatiellia bacterium]
MNRSILLCGVGGQGILLAAKVIGAAAELSGLSAVSNETHGMAQRGGSVKAQVKIGENVLSPLIMEGTADVLAAMEHAEALRNAHYLRPGGLAVVSAHSIVPVTATSGKAKYPDDIPERLARVFPRLAYCDCESKAIGLGNPRLANTILVGMLARELPFGDDVWHEAIRRSVKPKFLEENIAAFNMGRATVGA